MQFLTEQRITELMPRAGTEPAIIVVKRSHTVGILGNRNKQALHAACMGEMRNACKVLAGKSDGKRSVGRHKRRWEGDIKMDIEQIGCEDVNWIHLAPDKDQ
jgi:hypothetical protein